MLIPAILVAAAAALAIVLIAVGLASSSGGSGVNTRLQRYAAGGRPESGGGGLDGGALAALAQSATMSTISRVVEQREFGANLARELNSDFQRLLAANWGSVFVS